MPLGAYDGKTGHSRALYLNRIDTIAVDATNSPHISYFDESNLDLKYARGVQ